MTTRAWNPEDEVTITDRQVAVDVADEVVIFGVDSGTYFSVEEVGAEIWKLVQTPTSVQAICDALMREYDVEPDVCSREVAAFLDQLLDRGLIRRTS